MRARARRRSAPPPTRPFNLNFFCHRPPAVDAGARGGLARARSRRTTRELGLDIASRARRRRPLPVRRGERPAIVEELRAAGRELSLRPARRARCWRACARAARTILVERDDGRRGALARGARRRRGDRAGPRGGRPSRPLPRRRPEPQSGTFALLPQIVAARARAGDRGRRHRRRAGVDGALALGAAMVQVGTAYLLPGGDDQPVHRARAR